MNPQPTHNTTNIFTGLFLALILYFMLNGNKNKPHKSFDILDLGYSYDIARPVCSQPISYNITFQKQKQAKKITKKKTKPVTSKIIQDFEKEIDETTEVKETTQLDTMRTLAKDCYDTLVAIGYKKREAKKIVEDYFKKTSNPDITQFIKDITFKV